MATCKDCIHYNLCRSISRIQLGWRGNSVHYVENVEEICKDFKGRSRFVELPCHVGDTVYEIVERKASGKWVPIIVSHVVGTIEVCKNGTIGFRCGTTIWISADSAFLTREAAEQALEEREENAN